MGESGGQAVLLLSIINSSTQPKLLQDDVDRKREGGAETWGVHKKPRSFVVSFDRSASMCKRPFVAVGPRDNATSQRVSQPLATDLRAALGQSAGGDFNSSR